jgi:putative transposase
LRDECLNVETFFDLDDVREKLSRWQRDYNQVRPHSALRDRAPEEFVRDWRASSAPSLRTAGPANNLPACAVQGSDSANPKPLQLSGSPPVKMRGEAEKLPSGPVGQASAPSNLLETVN